MKLGLLAFEAATVAALIALLHRLGRPATRIVAYAWHPLPIWEIAGSGHVDSAMCALLMAGLLLFLHGRTLLAGVVVTLGALVKPTALLALPVFWRPWDWRLPLVVRAHRRPGVPALSVGRQRRAGLPRRLHRRGGPCVRPRVRRAVADGAVRRAGAGRGARVRRRRRGDHGRPRASRVAFRKDRSPEATDRLPRLAARRVPGARCRRTTPGTSWCWSRCLRSTRRRPPGC